MVEILAGGNFEQAVNSLDLTSAVCTYRYTPPADSDREEYQIWEMSDDDFSNICSVNEEDWGEDWGWWRHALGSNLGSVDCSYMVNSEKLMAWDGIATIDLARQNNMKLSELFKKYLG